MPLSYSVRKLPFTFPIKGLWLSLLLIPVSLLVAYPQCSETIYGVEQGLSHSSVLDIEQDENGFIWVFTAHGVCRFDGYRFKEYDVKLDNFRRSISFTGRFMKDRKGRIWIESSSPAVLMYDIIHDRINVVYKIVYHDFFDLVDSGNGEILISGSGCMLDIEEKENLNFSVKELKNPLEIIQVDRMHQYDDGNIIASAGNKLFRATYADDSIGYKDLKVLRQGSDKEFEFNGPIQFLISGEEFYLFTQTEILQSDLPVSGSFNDSVIYVSPLVLNFPAIELYQGQNIYSVINGDENEIFIRGYNGIYKYNTRDKTAERIKKESYGVLPGGEGEFRTTLYYSNDGILWAGTDHGLVKMVFGNKGFHSYMPETGNPNGLTTGKFCSVLIDKKNQLWIGSTSNGLFRSIPDSSGNYGTFKNFLPDSSDNASIHSNFVKVLFEDSRDRLWVGAGNIQWLDLNEKTEKFYYTKAKSYSETVGMNIDPHSIIEDNYGNIIVSARGSMPSWLITSSVDEAYALMLDSARNLLLWPYFWKTSDGEIYLYDNCRFYKISGDWVCHKVKNVLSKGDSLYTKKYFERTLLSWAYPSKLDTLLKLDSLHLLMSNFIISENSDEKELWQTMYYKEILMRSNMDFLNSAANQAQEGKLNYYTQFPEEEGISFTTIYQLIEDKKGRIWCSTRDGLICIDPQSGKYNSYYQDDGLPTNKLHWGAYLKEDGTLYLCTTNGLVYFQPDNIYPDPPSKLLLTGLEIYHQPVYADSSSVLKTSISLTDKLVLRYNRNFINIGFTALDYRNTQKIKYKFKMEGLDENWIEDNYNRIAEYPNLRPGKYTFRVISANGNGEWNMEGASMKIQILNPIWLRWWATLLEGMIFISILVYYISYREQNLKKQARILEEQVEEKTNQVLDQRKEVDELKNRFYTNISHEFRTPLGLVLGPVEDSLKSSQSPVSMDREIVKMIQRNAHRLQQLINQLLDISKLEAGKINMQVAEGDFTAFIKPIILSFLSLSESKKIKFSINIPANSHIIFFDRDKVEKILTNLLSNAFKFTSENGQVSITIRFKRERKKLKYKSVQIIIEDTGIGIPKEKLTSIFDRFYQVNDTDVREEGGTGIGLALCRELVEVYRGEISIKSKLGKGSVFTVTLPTSKAEFRKDEIVQDVNIETQTNHFSHKRINIEELQAANVLVENPPKANGFPLILIVEDNVDLRNYISGTLDHEYQVLMAENGATGLEKAIEKLPDLVISDVMMPVMNGMELCRKLKEDYRTNHIPVVMLTAKADRKSKLDGLELGVDDYIIKPFDGEELKIRVKNLIDQRIILREKFMRDFILDGSEMKIGIGDSFINKLVTMTENHLSDNEFRIDHLASELNMSRSQMYRKVQSLTHTTPNEFLKAIKMKRAALLLKTGTMNVTEVMYQLGLKNLSHFSRSFKNYYGVNPSEYLGNQ